MSERKDIPTKLIYSCRCGWLDKGHMNPTSERQEIGAANLLEQIIKETGPRSKTAVDGFQVVYRQSHTGEWRGTKIEHGITRKYWVKAGLTLSEKQSVTMSIFMEVSLGFETLQSSWLYTKVPIKKLKTDSGFSAEDLVSNLIGFYKAVDPSLDVPMICGEVSAQASLDVWDSYGPVGQHKNKTFQPLFFPCAECQCGTPAQGACKTGPQRHGGHSVVVGPDGKIVVKPGDWLSKYSAAMYQGDTSHVKEFGRLRGGKMEPIVNINQIFAGETIYHIPTYELSNNPARGANQSIPWTGSLPLEFQQIQPATKGTLFRDWTRNDDIPPDTRTQAEKNLPARWR